MALGGILLSALTSNLNSIVKKISHEINNYHMSEYVNDLVLGLILEEPSTRNRFSVSSAGQRLGYHLIVCDDLLKTSIHKGESIHDTSLVWANYFDVLAIRSRNPGVPQIISNISGIPVINLGDGANEHPTQALATLVSIYQRFGYLENINLLIWGDLSKGRVPHSLLLAAANVGMNIFLFPFQDYVMPSSYLKIVKALYPSVRVEIIDHLPDEINVLYLTREQTERRNIISNQIPYQVSFSSLDKIPLILHPLPRGSEISGKLWEKRKPEIIAHTKITYETRKWILSNIRYEENIIHPVIGESDVSLRCVNNGLCDGENKSARNFLSLDKSIICLNCMKEIHNEK